MKTRIRDILPRGGSLSDAEWQRRHRALLIMLWLNVVALPAYGLLEGYRGVHGIFHGGPVLAFAVLGGMQSLSRKMRSIVVSLGLLTCAALLVHISGGYIEAHFYFFVLIVALTIYEDWIPFLLAVAFVLLHHGIMGAIAPQEVFHSAEQFTDPWKWASIHAVFVAAAGGAGVVAWRLNEDVRAELVRSQAEAETAAAQDSLTGLANRRMLMIDLANAVSTATEVQPAALILFDLDGFKVYNDTFGHLAGDALLCRLSDRLREACGTHASAYRLGGDEFCVLTRAPEFDLARVEAESVQALTETGEGFTVSASYGSVLIPTEAGTSEEALRRADIRMYARKTSGRLPAGVQIKNVLVRALSERHPHLGHNLTDVAALAEDVGRRLGLTDQEVSRVCHAAELHDVGKLAIPTAIIGKPGPLDDQEWVFVKRHPLIGERIILAAPSLEPVARLVRSSHERFDGQGYPDGLTGNEIPLGSRIIAVCDAFDAMVSHRPYKEARQIKEALEELLWCAGTQFDPQVVDVFCRVVSTRLTAGLPARAA